ncbi:MAG: hypothetical protein ABEJ93_02495 [Candidatus Nanohalobium sp.]
MKRKSFLILAAVFFTPSVLGINASLVNSTGDKVNLSFDRASSSEPFDDILSSRSYTDNSLTNPNVYARVCGQGLQGEKIQLYYGSESKNLTAPILSKPAEIPSFTGDCTSVDIDISAFRAKFPGKPFIGLVNGSSPANLTKLNQSFKGDYKLGVRIRRLDGFTDLKLDKIEDENRNTIYGKGDSRYFDSIFLTVVNRDDEIVAERVMDNRDYRSFKMLFEGGERVYVNGMLVLKTRAVNQCGNLNKSNSYYILNGSQYNKEASCVKVKEIEDSAFDFANYTIDGDNNQSMNKDKCALTINNSQRVYISGAKVQQYRKGICIYNSNSINVEGLSSQANKQGIYSENSSSAIREITLSNNQKAIRARNSNVRLDEAGIPSGPVTGYVENVDLVNVEEAPENPTDNLFSMDLFVNVTELGNGKASSFGFNFEPIVKTSINPVTLYKFDKVLGKDNLTASSLETNVDPEDRLIVAENNLTDFSIIGAYGEKIEGTGSGEGDGEGTQPEPQPEPEPVPDPLPQPQPSPVDLNLFLDNNSAILQQGEIFNVNFTVENEGEVPSGIVTVGSETPEGWISSAVNLSVPPGSNRSGEALLGVWKDEVPGTYDIPYKIYSSTGAVLDTEVLSVEVEPRQQVHRLKIVDSPSFIEFTAGSSSEVAFLVDNVGDYSYSNITLEVRQADNCINSVKGSHSLDKGERDTLEFQVEISSDANSCSGVFVLNTDKKKAAGFAPVRIKVKEENLLDRATSGILPIILIIWTIITIWTVKRS